MKIPIYDYIFIPIIRVYIYKQEDNAAESRGGHSTPARISPAVTTMRMQHWRSKLRCFGHVLLLTCARTNLPLAVNLIRSDYIRDRIVLKRIFMERKKYNKNLRGVYLKRSSYTLIT